MRCFPGIGILLLGLLPLGAEGGRASAAEPRRPNILFLFADDWGRQASIYAEVAGPIPKDLPQPRRPGAPQPGKVAP